MNTLIVTSSIILLLHPPLSFSLHHHLNSPNLLDTFILTADKLTDQQVFPDHDALLIYDIIELALFLLDDILLIVLLVVIIVVFLIIEVLLWLLLLLLIALVVKLIQDILDLALELLITLLHEILQDFWHPELLGFLSQLLASENGIKGTVHIGAHLQVVMLN